MSRDSRCPGYEVDGGEKMTWIERDSPDMVDVTKV